MKTSSAFLVISILLSSHSFADSKNERSDCKGLERLIDSIEKNENYRASAVNSFYKQFKSNPKCDDGWYAESLTEFVVKTTILDFTAIVRKSGSDKEFLNFIKRHINATADWDDLDKISVKASKGCPKGLSSVCEEIRSVSTAASKEAREASAPKK